MFDKGLDWRHGSIRGVRKFSVYGGQVKADKNTVCERSDGSNPNSINSERLVVRIIGLLTDDVVNFVRGEIQEKVHAPYTANSILSA